MIGKHLKALLAKAKADGRTVGEADLDYIAALEADVAEAREAATSTRTTPPPQPIPDPSGGRAPAGHIRQPEGGRSYQLMRLLRAQGSGDFREARIEMRTHDELRERHGEPHHERALHVPYRALLPIARQLELERRDVDSTGAGSLISTDLAAEDFIELLRNQAAVVAAGARMLPGLVGNVDIPRQNAAAAGGWIATETGAPSEGQLTTDVVSLVPKTFGMRTEITRKILKQSTPAAEDLVREDMRRVIGLALDLAAISGSGASGQPTGITVASGTSVVTHSSALSATLANILEYESDLGTANAPPRRAFIMRSAAKAVLKSSIKHATAAAGFLMEPDGSVNGNPSFVTEQAPASGASGAILCGAFEDLLVGMWGVLDLFSDPYTLGNSGGMVVRGFQDIDIGIRHAASFCKSATF
jgi:HK97 family phage major capsid protein